ncbi:MAG: DUF6261 family protein [Mangrovibacterium sp.]
MEIPIINRRASVDEVIEVTESIVRGFKLSRLTSDSNLQLIIETLAEKHSNLLSSQKRDRMYIERDQYYNLRDLAYQRFYLCVQGCALLNDSHAPSHAAKKLLLELESYGAQLAHMPYEEQTTQIDSLIEKLSSPDCQQQMNALLHLNSIFESLKSHHANFKKINEQCEIQPESEPICNYIPQLFDVLNNQLVMYMRAMAQAIPELYAPYSEMLAETFWAINQKLGMKSYRSVAHGGI